MVPRIDAVIFDVGGVLADQDLEAADLGYGRVSDGLTAERVNRTRRTPRLYPLWESYSIGGVDTSTYWSEVARELGLDEDDWPRLRQVHSDTVWSRRLDGGWRAARGLRARDGLGLGVLSNSAPECEPNIGDLLGFFDVLHFSHRTGRRKPNDDAYEGVMAEIGTSPGHTVFIDDRPLNVRAALRLGIRALAFTSGPDLAADLASLGLLMPTESAD